MVVNAFEVHYRITVEENIRILERIKLCSAVELWDYYLFCLELLSEFCLESLSESCRTCGVVQKQVYVQKVLIRIHKL
jgi:hypothetical protein